MDLPASFLERMKTLLGNEYESWISSFDAPHVHGLRANPLKAGTDELMKMLDFELEPIPWCDTGFYYPHGARPGKSPLHDAGLFYIQEPSAQLPAELLDPKPGMRVLDLCAAPGGKTTQLAGKMKNEGLIIANEPYLARARVLAQNVERMGIRNAVVTSVMPDVLAERFPEYFDRIMVDAPCSGEGMFRKDIDTRGEWSEDIVALCADRQAEILDCAVAMLSPGGRMVYSTCTFSPEENERQIARLIKKYPLKVVEFYVPGVSKARPEWADGEAALSGCFRIWPHISQGEGHFAALLEKEGEPGYTDYIPPAPQIKNEEYTDFCNDVLENVPHGAIYAIRDELYLVPIDSKELNGVRVIRNGLHLGTCKKNRFEPSHALALGVCALDVRRRYELKEDEIIRYLKGEALTYSGEGGWTLITVHNHPIGWGKASAGMLKNHYPKGLRRMGNEE